MDPIILAQLGLLDNNIYSIVASFVIFLLLFLLYPRMMLSQIMWKLEKIAIELEGMSEKSKIFMLKEISKNPDKKTRDSVSRFFEFFFIQPVSLDPLGSVQRFDHIITAQKDRFKYFVNQVAPDADEEKKANIMMGFAAGIALYDLTKIVRHFIELVRKNKSFQIAMILQMQMPMIESIAKSLYKGNRALAKGNPIGDGIGPLVAATLLGNQKTTEIEEDIVMGKAVVEGRNLFVLKAKGPGGRIGAPGKAVEKIINTVKISRVISVDAAAKLEGEKTGSIAEGVGVAMGGPGVERSYIENVVVKKNVPLDSIIVKMSQEEAITPMKKSIKDAVPEVLETIKRNVMMAKKGDNIVLVGVGNTSGVGNSKKDAKETDEWVEKNHKRLESLKKKKK
ncbi:MAG: DUF1512 domain-containing protein [Candidatus Aenigmatarchaeota archaeon]